MATQTVEFRSPPSQTVTAKLFAVGSDTEQASVSATEATNRKGTYSAAFTDEAAGEYELIAFVGSVPVARWFVTLTLTTATFQARDKVGAVELDSAAILAVADQVWDEAMSGHTTAGTYGGRIVRATSSNTEVQITGSNHIAADVHEFQTGVITAGDFAANSITASALATDAVTEIQTGLATAATALSTTQWTNTLATDLGTTNTTVATNLNATVSSRSTQTSVDTIDDLLDTEMPALTAAVAAEAVKTSAIKAKTDNLPTDPADQSLVEAAITAATSPLATPAQVNAEVVDVLSVDTFAELSAPPAATSSLKDKLTWLFMYARNKVTQTATTRTLYRDDTTTVAGTSGTSDNGTTFTKGEDA